MDLLGVPIFTTLKEWPLYGSVFTGTHLLVGSSVGDADALDLRSTEPGRTGPTAEARGCVDAAYTHVARLHRALRSEEKSLT